MPKIKLGLFHMPIPDKIALAARIVTAMTGNPNFTTPVPALADITAKKTALLTAYNDALSKRAQAKAATDLMADNEKELDRSLMLESLYVENESVGDT